MKPIIFSGPMVRAILNGTKTQTRRVVKPQPALQGDTWFLEKGLNRSAIAGPSGICHAGAATHAPWGRGDRLWVREEWWHYKSPELEQAGFQGGTICLLDSGPSKFHANPEFDPSKYKIWRKRPSIFMPRWASRITLEITDVRVQRLQEITEEDAISEGLSVVQGDGKGWALGLNGKAQDTGTAFLSIPLMDRGPIT